MTNCTHLALIADDMKTKTETIPPAVAMKAKHAEAHGASEEQVRKIINDWLVKNGRSKIES